ncbi:MAG: low molecular weight protein-tyrosine-phosphatase [Actinomycetales bacterium]
MPPPYRITTVCLGNICRSPITEVVLTDRIHQAGLGDQVLVDSAGTGDWHVGGQADRRTIAVLTQHGYQINHVPRQITSHWFADINLLLAMDSANFSDLQRMAPSGPNVPGATSLRMLRSFDPALAHLNEPHPELDVPDPYYGNPEDFEVVLDLVERAADGVVNFVQLDLSR